MKDMRPFSSSGMLGGSGRATFPASVLALPFLVFRLLLSFLASACRFTDQCGAAVAGWVDAEVSHEEGMVILEHAYEATPTRSRARDLRCRAWCKLRADDVSQEASCF